jgi:hypothetical protein
MSLANLKEQSPKRILWAVIGLALLIRLWGIGYGLPFVYWTDEYHEVMRALELGSGGFNLSRTGKGGFYILLFVEYGLYFTVLKITGIVSSAREFAEQFVRDPSAFYLMGRVTAVVFGCATIAVAYHLARRAYLASAGILAALFLTVNILHVDLSHRVGVDVPMTFFASLALYFGLRIASDGHRRDYLLAGLCAALATTTKLPGILVLVPLLTAHAYFVAGTSGGARGWLASRGLWQAVAVFVVVLAISNPGILIHFDPFALFATQPDLALGDDAMTDGAGFSAAVRPNLFVFYLNVLLISMGWPLFLLAMGSIAYALWRHRPADVILLSYAGINYLAISSTTSDVLYFPRYALPILVVLAVLSGRVLAEIVGAIPRWRAAASVILTAIFVAGPLYQAVSNSHVLTQADTRTLAKEWFDAHVPAGSRVFIEGTRISASRLTVPLTDSRASLERRIAYWKEQEPRQARFLEVKQAVHEGGGYDLELAKLASIEPLDDYVERGVEYFVVRPESFTGSRKAEAGSARLVNALRSDGRVQLLKRIDTAAGKRPGPPIDIYRYHAEATSDE